MQSATGAVFGQYIIDGLNTKGRTAGASVTGNVNDVWISQLAVEEMRFITNGYDAQYEGGTEVTMVETKRGTNNLEIQAFANGYQDWMRAQGPLVLAVFRSRRDLSRLYIFRLSIPSSFSLFFSSSLTHPPVAIRKITVHCLLPFRFLTYPSREK